ncbi:MAG: GNAT family N-acetyltransferase [Eubacteriales bacterium]|nr:GNAT family N-acetyltransferase [Eubacteriales bacterium]
MVREAMSADIDGVEKNYIELLNYEKEHDAFTVWQLGVYPTKETAEEALSNGNLYVIEQTDGICASMILNRIQPEEYNMIPWKWNVEPEEVMVLHLLCVSPWKKGCGFGTQMMEFAIQKATALHCKVIRLDTGSQNKPAIAFYTKFGFQLAGTTNMLIGGKIQHQNHFFFELKI